MEHLVGCSKHYVLVNGELMRKNVEEELLEMRISGGRSKILEEIHAGTCDNQAASCTLVGKAFWVGFYWSSAIADIEKLVRHCEGC